MEIIIANNCLPAKNGKKWDNLQLKDQQFGLKNLKTITERIMAISQNILYNQTQIHRFKTLS